MPYLWKAMKAGLRSGYDDSQWEIGKWRKVKDKPSLCGNGFHASKNIINAMRYTNMEVLAKVEVRGDVEKGDDKQVWTEMRVAKAWEWKKEDSVALAVYAASLVLHNFEDVYPDDKRPRQAIGAAKTWLKNPTEKNMLTAESAARSATWPIWSTQSAAWPAAWSAARSAESAAWSAARSAESAAWPAAWSAARSAESAAWPAAWSAARSAESAAYQKTFTKCHRWVVKRTKRLIPIKERKRC